MVVTTTYSYSAPSWFPEGYTENEGAWHRAQMTGNGPWLYEFRALDISDGVGALEDPALTDEVSSPTFDLSLPAVLIGGDVLADTDDDYAYSEDMLTGLGELRDNNVAPVVGEPLWEVYINGDRTGSDSGARLLHTTAADNTAHIVLQPKLSLEFNEAGSFSFTILPTHELYDALVPYQTTLTVYSEGVELFRGRVKGYTTDIYRQRNVECEGDLAYLTDVLVQTGSWTNTTIGKLLNAIIKKYNAALAGGDNDPRAFAAGTSSEDEVTVSRVKNKVTITDTSNKSKEYTDVRAILDEIMGAYGGYIRTARHDDGKVYLEYLAGYTAVNPQLIYYGGNLQDITISTAMGELVTVLIPEGDDNSTSSSTGALMLSRNKNGATDNSTPGQTIVHKKGSDEIYWEEGVAKYGRIMKTESFSGITDAAKLRARATAYLKESATALEGNFSIKAVDMHYIDSSIRPIYLGDKVVIISSPHGIDTSSVPLTCMKIDYDLTNPEQTQYEFDIPYQLLTGTLSKKVKKQKKEADSTKRSTKRNGAGVRKNAAGVEENKESIGKTESELSNLKTRVSDAEKKIKELKLGGYEYSDKKLTDCFSVSLEPETVKVRDKDGKEVNVVKKISIDVKSNYHVVARKVVT